jgi:hypothetical protein
VSDSHRKVIDDVLALRLTPDEAKRLRPVLDEIEQLLYNGVEKFVRIDFEENHPDVDLNDLDQVRKGLLLLSARNVAGAALALQQFKRGGGLHLLRVAAALGFDVDAWLRHEVELVELHLGEVVAGARQELGW